MDTSQKHFIHIDFLLESKEAKELYHNYAASHPIIDYHNHLSPEAIANNTSYNNITKLWLADDHYKWRAMRALGINERFITGDASDKDKFIKFAEAMPYMLRNPLYHWTHLELSRYFGIKEQLSLKNAEAVYEETSALAQTKEYSTQSLLEKMNVEMLCTTEDPIDSLQHHTFLAKSDFNTKVNTAFRPDKSLFINGSAYNTYIDQLEEASNCSINTYEDLCVALEKQMEYFHSKGCRLSDHGLEYIPFQLTDQKKIDRIFRAKRSGENVSPLESEQFQTALLIFLGKKYSKLGWVQQFHLGAMRNNNTRMLNKMGPDSGWDSIGDYSIAFGLSRYLDLLDSTDQLSKTILYNLNPADNEIMATMIGNFNDGSAKGKIQWGSGWWFMDQLDGMSNQINTLSNMGLISCFIGMLTDSRSFLSFPRHEYFRRLLCNIFGQEMEKGLLPNDPKWVGKIISDICYYNAKEYFKY